MSRDSLPQIHAIDEFLRRGVELGQLLDRAEDRDTAQSMLDYWASVRDTLNASAKELAAKSASVQHAILQPFKRELIEEAMKKGDRTLSNLGSEDSSLALRILMRLVRLDGPTRTFSSAPATLASVRSLSEAKEVDKIVAQLKQTGVLRQFDDDQKQPSLQLASDSLMRQWKPLADALAQRLRFRRAAEFWDSHDRDREALFAAGPLLEEALAYRDLGELEKEFAEASRARRDRSRQVQLSLLSIAVVVLGVGCIVQLYQRSKLSQQAVELQSKNDQLAAAGKKLEDEKALVSAKRDELAKTVEELKQASQLAGLNEAEAQRQKKISDESLKSIDRLIKDILATKSASADPEVRELGDKYKAEYTALIAKLPKPQATEKLGPGSRIGPPGGNVHGTAGVFVEDKQGKRFLLMPQYLFSGASGDSVLEYNWGHAENNQGTPIGKIIKFTTAGQYNMAFAQLRDGVSVWEQGPASRVTGLEKKVKVGMAVQMIGATSGLKTGVVNSIEKNGTVITTRLSEPGDAGAAVLTMDGKLIGVLTGSSDKESFVTPVNETIEKLNLVLLKPKSEEG
ncbi:S1 family peptidase [Anatilimnocola floriformis]|uniref:S1 family peptidase n=1 Tax=Anatilimnocola floriformis TaxID=2948575 RepID=UPI0020C54BF4|nr:S1 family peptidase [Anatilimnocola floriformis]